MGKDDRYMVTKIRDTKVNNVSMSIDEGTTLDGPDDEIVAVMLYTPWMGDTNEHYHISFNREQAISLKEWLDDFLNEPDIKKRFKNDLTKGE